MTTLQHTSAGFTYIGILLAVAMFSAGLAAIGQSWRANVQRSKEAELLFVGEQFKSAIKSYYESSPGGDKRLPKTLEDLVQDKRYPVIKRHIRKIYRDPLSGKAEWGLVMLKDGIMGVYSLSEDEPFKNRNPVTPPTALRVRYADWRFVADIAFTSETTAAANATAPAPPPPADPTAPADVVSEPAAVTPRPKPPTDRCERLQIADARACKASAARNGSPDAQCEESAATRYGNCLAGVAIGPLWIRQ